MENDPAIPAGSDEPHPHPVQETQPGTDGTNIIAAQESTEHNNITETHGADASEYPTANGTAPAVDSGAQTEPMPAEVSNGVEPAIEGDVPVASSTPAVPDSRPSVLIVGGLGNDRARRIFEVVLT